MKRRCLRKSPQRKNSKNTAGTLLTKHVRVTVLGTFIMLATYTLFYIMTVYSMTYSTAAAPVGAWLAAQ
ncbi:metabolite transport protein [Salmonella enterica subsp. enterica]|nr:metabolite transport protein [Salmonella enterica subsp. enterica] [Salmonella enterica subsp. enterica serovar Menston]